MLDYIARFVMAPLFFISKGRGNFHTVDEGKVYRSEQLIGFTLGYSREVPILTLEDVVRKHKFKSVLNLRGERKGKGWFEQEQYVCKHYGVEHKSVEMSASELPKKESLIELFDFFDNPDNYPNVVHCYSGSDRTGLVSTLYRYHYLNHSLDDSLRELRTFPFGHVKISGAKNMDNFFEMFRESKEKNLKKWVEDSY